MNVDSSYMQFMSSLMNDDGFELPLGSRRFSIGSDFDLGKELHETDEVGRDRTFSWGDAGFEEILHSLGRSRAMSEMSTGSDLSIRPHVLAPPDAPLDTHPVRMSSFPQQPQPITEQPVSASEFNINQMSSNAQLQFPQQFQLLIQNNAFLPNQLMSGQMMSVVSENRDDDKIGAYTRQERREKIAKYRAKRSQRVFRKQVKYDCRKKLADTRPRVKGRFVTKVDDEPVEENMKPPLPKEEKEDEGSEEGPLEAVQAETSRESFP